MKNIKTYEELDNGKLLKDIKTIGRKVTGHANKFSVDNKYLTPLELVNSISHPAIERVELIDTRDSSAFSQAFKGRNLAYIRIHIKLSSIQEYIDINLIKSIQMDLFFDKEDSYPHLASNSFIRFTFSKEVPDEYLTGISYYTYHLGNLHDLHHDGKKTIKYIKDKLDNLNTIIDSIKSWFKKNQEENQKAKEYKNKVEDFNKVVEYFEDCLYDMEELSESYDKAIKEGKFTFMYHIPGIKVRKMKKQVHSSQYSSYVDAYFDEASLIMTDELVPVFKALVVAKARMSAKTKSFEMTTHFKNDQVNVIIEYKTI
jgi:hypothetical protein